MRVIPGFSLWLGHIGDARDIPSIIKVGIGAVIDLALNEPPVTFSREMAYCRFPLIDSSGNPPWLLRAAVETVACLIRSRTPTLVYCGAGMSRSPSVTGAAIALVVGCSPSEGLAIVVRSGPVDLSPALWAEIVEAFT